MRSRCAARAYLMAAMAGRVATADPGQPVPSYEVVVREPVGPIPAARDETAASTVRKGEELARPGGTVADVLSLVPGAQVTRSGSSSDFASASIRAASAAQTPVLLAGVRLNDEATGGVDLSSVPLWMLDRIEVYRGDAPAFSDQLGLGGAIVLEPELPAHRRARAGLGAGSYGERGAWGGLSTGSEKSWALIGLRADRATNDYPYVDDGATRFSTRGDRVVERPNADSASYDLWAVGRHLVGAARLTSVINVFDRTQGVSGLLVVPALRARASARRWLGAVGTRVPCGAMRRACSVELSTTALSTRTGLSDPARELGLGTTRVHNASVRLTQDIGVAFEPFERTEVRVGGLQSLDSLDLWRLGSSRRVSRRSRTSGTLAVAYHPGSTWTLQALGRADCQSTTETSARAPCALFEPSGRVGAKWVALDALTLLANVGRYVRVPTLGELFGISATVLGNPGLVPEAGVSADLGARVAAQSNVRGGLAARAETWVFARHASDLVAYRRSSFGILRPFNVGSARILGLEASAGARWLDALQTDLAVTLLDPRDVSENRTQPNDLLPLMSRLVLVDSFRAYQKLDNRVCGYASLELRVTHRSSRYADPAGTVTIPHQWSTDLVAVTRWFRDRWTLRAALENLFDVHSFDLVGLPLAGRTWHASAEATW